MCHAHIYTTSIVPAHWASFICVAFRSFHFFFFVHISITMYSTIFFFICSGTALLYQKHTVSNIRCRFIPVEKYTHASACTQHWLCWMMFYAWIVFVQRAFRFEPCVHRATYVFMFAVPCGWIAVHCIRCTVVE